jgi:hypothetical protein
MTHDYKRNGTTTLFAAIEMTEGRLIGTCMSQHRHQEWIKFLKQIDAESPAELDLHLIVDNYATHKHPTTFPHISFSLCSNFHALVRSLVNGSRQPEDSQEFALQG